MSITLSADVSGTFGTIKINGVDQLRIYNDGTLKSPAGKVISTSQGILGTVSQLAGVPTGSIIERNSNANGEYVKFADGAMICQLTMTYKPGSSATGALYISAMNTWTFPAAFIQPPNTFGSDSSSYSRWPVCKTYSDHSDFVFFSAVSTITDTRNVRLTAIGKWF